MNQQKIECLLLNQLANAEKFTLLIKLQLLRNIKQEIGLTTCLRLKTSFERIIVSNCLIKESFKVTLSTYLEIVDLTIRNKVPN